MNNTVFSHRPLAGVSIAATSSGGKLYFAIALANDGTSRNQIFHRERRDSFSRPVARNILRGRLENLKNGGHDYMGVTFDTNMNTRDFMARVRKHFKPTPDESDSFLCETEERFGMEWRYRPSAAKIVEKIMHVANEVVANHMEKKSS